MLGGAHHQVIQHERVNFDRLVSYYFPARENFIMTPVHGFHPRADHSEIASAIVCECATAPWPLPLMASLMATILQKQLCFHVLKSWCMQRRVRPRRSVGGSALPTTLSSSCCIGLPVTAGPARSARARLGSNRLSRARLMPS